MNEATRNEQNDRRDDRAERGASHIDVSHCFRPDLAGCVATVNRWYAMNRRDGTSFRGASHHAKNTASHDVFGGWGSA